MPTALITGITGQDGSYLAEFLLSKDYAVHGVSRQFSLVTDLPDYTGDPSLHFDKLSTSDKVSLRQSSVQATGSTQRLRAGVTGLSTVRILEAMRRAGSQARFYQASSSEMFGAAPPPQNERTPFQPQSPYAAAKFYA